MKSNDLGATGHGDFTDTDTAAINVLPVVHAPTLTVTTPIVTGFNGLTIPIGVTGTLTDNNKPELLTFDVSNVPAVAVLHDGLGTDDTGQSSYTFTLNEMMGMTIMMPLSPTTTQFTLSITAVATDAAINQSDSSVPGTITVTSTVSVTPIVQYSVQLDDEAGHQITTPIAVGQKFFVDVFVSE